MRTDHTQETDDIQKHEAWIEDRMSSQGPAPMLLMDLAFIRLAQGRSEDALTFATQAMVKADAEVRTHASICCALAAEQLGRYDSVVAYLSRIAAHPSLPAQMRIALGDAYFRSGLWLEAVECYDRVLGQYPRRFDVHRRKLKALWRQALENLQS